MNDQTDQQLLRDYAERHSEAAFAAIVQRYVDLVYSAALRMLCDTHAAKDVTQCVFVALAQNARRLTDRPALAGWLHDTARNLAAKAVRSDVRRRAREQEAAVMIELLSANPDASWEHIAPYLDDALGELSDPERDAVLLRYFKNHDLRTVGATLGISDDAAQKRVSRAVERLREFFTKRGVTVGASGLTLVISANAVQAAPVGLALTISTAAALTGTTLATTATVTATKAIAMTALHKTIVTATIAVLAGGGIYEARQASQLRGQVQTLQQQQTPLSKQITDLNQALIDATNQLAVLRDDNERLNRNTAELLRLRGEIALLRTQTNDLDTLREENHRLQQQISAEAKTPQQRMEEEEAKKNFVYEWHGAFLSYAKENQLQFPTSFEQAAPFLQAEAKFDHNLTPSQFDIVYHGRAFQSNQSDVVLLREKQPWVNAFGKWARIYGMADGTAVVISPPTELLNRDRKPTTTYNSFEAWEQLHITTP